MVSVQSPLPTFLLNIIKIGLGDQTSYSKNKNGVNFFQTQCISKTQKLKADNKTTLSLLTAVTQQTAVDFFANTASTVIKKTAQTEH